MSDVLVLLEFDCDDDGLCTVVADVDDAVVTCPASLLDPEEYGPALCRGSFYLQDDEVIPEDDGALCEFVQARVNYWEVIDMSDLHGACEDCP
jgi:hypothetical protein